MASDDLHILYLEPYDDAVSTRDRLKFVDAHYVLLVWPSNARILRRKLDLLLIQREATRQGQRIALVAHDLDVIDHARDLDLSVFPNVGAAQRQPWKHPRDRVFAVPGNVDDLVAPDDLPYDDMPPGPARHRRRHSWRWVMFVTLWIALGAGFLLVAPSATVTITPAGEQVSARVPITGDLDQTDVDLDERTMPLSLITRRISTDVTASATGRQIAEPARATGIVVFTNESDFSVEIPPGTIVSTGSTPPIRFETQEELILPVGAHASTRVRALEDSAGTRGNVGANTILFVEGALSDSVTATNPNVTEGGTIRELSIVTEEDVANLLTAGYAAIIPEARVLLQHEYGDGLIPQSVQIVEGTQRTGYNALVGDATESLRLHLEIDVQAVVINERLAQQVAYAGLAPQIPPGREMSPDSLVFELDLSDIPAPPYPDGRIQFAMTVTGQSTVGVDADHVRDRVAGVSVDEAKRRLQRELLLNPNRPPKITVWPGWFNRMPVLPIRITVKVDEP
jgi:hypothetical protein